MSVTRTSHRPGTWPGTSHAASLWAKSLMADRFVLRQNLCRPTSYASVTSPTVSDESHGFTIDYITNSKLDDTQEQLSPSR